MCRKNRINIFDSFIDIQENAEWSRFLAHPVVIGVTTLECDFAGLDFTELSKVHYGGQNITQSSSFLDLVR